MELEGVIEANGPFYASSSSANPAVRRVVGRFDPRRAEFRRRLMSQAREGGSGRKLDTVARRGPCEPRYGSSRAGYLESKATSCSRSRESARVTPHAGASGRERMGATLAERFWARGRGSRPRCGRFWIRQGPRPASPGRCWPVRRGARSQDAAHCGTCLGESRPCRRPRAREQPADGRRGPWWRDCGRGTDALKYPSRWPAYWRPDVPGRTVRAGGWAGGGVGGGAWGVGGVGGGGWGGWLGGGGVGGGGGWGGWGWWGGVGGGGGVGRGGGGGGVGWTGLKSHARFGSLAECSLRVCRSSSRDGRTGT